MSLKKDDIIYTAEDIQKYLEGKLGPAEMHAMERAALDDAFLAEAMEGYSGMQNKDWETQLLALKNNFPNKQPSARIIGMRPAAGFAKWKAAAAVVVICSGLAITYLLTGKQSAENRSIATIKSKDDSANPKIADMVLADTGSNTIAAMTEKASESKKIAAGRVDQKVITDSSFLYRPATADEPLVKKDAGEGYVTDTINNSHDFAVNNAAPATNQKSAESYKLSSEKAPDYKNADAGYLKKATPVIIRKFEAQVVGPDGSALPFANISITKDNIGTYADARGNFRLASADSLLNIEIKSAGYITRNFTLTNSNPQSKIVLEEDNLALKEKTIVTGKPTTLANAKRRRSALLPDSVTNVEPEDGWVNYDTYITNNLSIPDDILQKKIHGEVEVSFDVQSNGALTNVKIDKSLCDDCDEAALRVIKEGPRWKVKNGNQGTAKIKVKF